MHASRICPGSVCRSDPSAVMSVLRRIRCPITAQLFRSETPRLASGDPGLRGQCPEAGDLEARAGDDRDPRARLVAALDAGPLVGELRVRATSTCAAGAI